VDTLRGSGLGADEARLPLRIAIERWENEGGTASLDSDGTADRHRRSASNRAPLPTGSRLPALPDDLPSRVLGGSPDAILICDPRGKVQYWNAAAERIFGFSATEALGVSMDLIIPERLRARHWTGWETTLRTGVTRYGEGQMLAVPALHKDGRQISIEFSIQLLQGAGGQIEWVVAVIRDVTERYGREKLLRTRLKALEAQAALHGGATGARSAPALAGRQGRVNPKCP
jgi:PAS domain S-box-containing protein